MQQNSLKKKLQEGQVCLGTFGRLGPAAVEILGYTGWDFVVIDMEHGGFDIPQVQHLLRAAKSVGITGLVRVPEPTAVQIMRALDAGAEGVQIPQITTAQDAKLVSKAARYFPEGNRGLCSFVRAAGYSAIPPKEHLPSSNKEVLTIIHIEGEESAKNADALLDIPGIDVIFLGPWDLSQSLGVPGDTKHPKVINVMEEVIVKCRQKGVAVGTFITNPQDAKYWADRGVQYLMYSTDAGMLVENSKEKYQALDQALRRD